MAASIRMDGENRAHFKRMRIITTFSPHLYKLRVIDSVSPHEILKPDIRKLLRGSFMVCMGICDKNQIFAILKLEICDFLYTA